TRVRIDALTTVRLGFRKLADPFVGTAPSQVRPSGLGVGVEDECVEAEVVRWRVLTFGSRLGKAEQRSSLGAESPQLPIAGRRPIHALHGGRVPFAGSVLVSQLPASHGNEEGIVAEKRPLMRLLRPFQ